MKNLLPLLVLAAGLHPAQAQPTRARLPAPVPTYRVTKTARIGGEGGWDYLSPDHAGNRLYVSHRTQVEVLNLTTLAKIGTVANTPGVHGILVVPGLAVEGSRRGFVSCGGNGTVLLFDPATGLATGTVPVGKGPDALLYDAFSGRVFVFNHGGGTATALDAASGEVAGTVEIGGALEEGATDGAGTIFVNVEDKNEIVAFDAKTLTVTHRWPLAPGEEPTGLAYEAATHRLFAACGNKLLVVLDARTGKVLGTAPTGAGTDGLALDPARHLAFTPNGEDGTLTVVRTDAADGTFPVVQTLTTAPGARTITLDPATHRLYLPTADYGPAPAPTAAVPHPRRSVGPGTFRVLEVSP